MKKLFIPLTLALALTACQKEIKPTQSGQTLTTLSSPSGNFIPPVNVVLTSGMLSFSSYNDFQTFLLAVQTEDPLAVKEWEASIGFHSQRTRFYEIIAEESALDEYYENLSPADQQQLLNGPEQHSNAYNTGIADGLITVNENDPEKAAYDYTVCLPSYAGVINGAGFVRIENKIYQVTPTAIKIILDGNESKIPLLDNMNTDLIDEQNGIIVNLHTLAKTTGTGGSLYTNFSSMPSDWHYTGSKTRLKAWIEGYSQPYGSPYYSDCAQFLQCTFQLRTEAQKKNFWGKWVYNNYYPTFIVNNGSWSYTYNRFIDHNGCGIYTTTQGNDLSYSSAFHPAYGPLVNRNYGGTNNGYFTLVPHGTWAAAYNPGYFSTGFNMHYNFTLNYGGKSYSYTK